MLTLALLCLVTVPMLIDLAVCGRHQTIELSMVRAGERLDKRLGS
jgi:hypothetical protein